MKKNVTKATERFLKLLLVLVIANSLLVSCDIYELDDKEPDWLGASIYDYLKTDGNFTVYTKLIEDLDYVDILSQTGSKTLFVADDDAFDVFFANNPWGVSNYDQLTRAQKSLLLNYGMINNAYLVSMLSNYNNGGLKESEAFRRVTAVSVIDSIPFAIGDQLPGSVYWTYYKTNGL